MKTLLLVVVVGCGSARTSPSVNPASSDNASHIANIERHIPPRVRFEGDHRTLDLTNLMHMHRVPAISVAVFDRYQLQWAHAWGYANLNAVLPATETTLFRAGGLSETGNTLAVLETVAEGKLALDRPINDELVSWKLPENELTKQQPVTLRAVLGHVAGITVNHIRGYARGEALPMLQQMLDGTPPASSGAVRVDLAPGTTFRFSEGGVIIAQLALVEQWKQPYPEILARRVLGPLGMTHSTYEQPLPTSRAAEAATGYRSDETEHDRQDRVYPEMAAAGLWTTPTDLARLFAEIALARSGRSKLISREIGIEMTTKSAQLPDANPLGTILFEKGGTMMFGLGASVDGFRSRVYASLDGGYGVVIMTNSDNGSELADQIFDAVANEYHWPAAERPLVRVALDATQRAAFAGWYFQPTRKLLAAQVQDVGGSLEFRTPFNPPRKLVPIAVDTLVDPSSGSRVRLAADHALAFGQNGRSASPFLPAGPEVPIMFTLEAGHFDEAVAALQNRKPGNAELVELNDLAYAQMLDQPANAVRILLFAAAVFPASSNTEDSLGEAYVAAHEPTHAIAAYQSALALLDADPFIPADEKVLHRKNAMDALAKLQAK